MLITHATILTMDPARPLLLDGALAIEKGLIAGIGPTAQIKADRRNDPDVVDASDRWIMPGLICAHTHFYGAFARGLALPGEPPADFVHILERLWWRLDKALDAESMALSARVCLIDAIRHGTTTLIDHHASPNAIDGSLGLIAEAVRQAGLRTSLCYEVTDRDGPERAQAGIRENGRFVQEISRSADRPFIGATLGLHASLTLSPQTLEACARLAADLGVGCHIHVAEGAADVHDSLQKYGCRVVERLARAGILGPKTIAAHCIHLDEREKDILAQTRTNVVHNPRSNMNNAVGVADVTGMLARGIAVGLGNDGFSNNMFTEMNAAYLLHKHAAGDPRAMPANQVLRMAFDHNAHIAACAGLPENLGVLRVGAPADMIILEHHPTTPLVAENAPWHVLFGIDGTGVETVIVGGRVLMRNRQLVTLDEAEITFRSRQAARRAWERIA